MHAALLPAILVAGVLGGGCLPSRVSGSPGAPRATAPPRRIPHADVGPLPGWPRWAGDANYQISGLAVREGRLFAIPDQSGAETRALLEIDLTDERTLPIRVLCRWSGGPHPDAEGLALAPFAGPPESMLLPLESNADALIEVAFSDCGLRSIRSPLLGSASNQGIEGIALGPDGETVYLVGETNKALLVLSRSLPGPPRLVARLDMAASLCDAAYDDHGTGEIGDDRLLVLDRNGRQIFRVTLEGRITGTWRLQGSDVRTDPDGFRYGLSAFEALAIETRHPDGSLLVYAATDTPPRPIPYRRLDGKDPAGHYQRRVGMLYRFLLPPLPEEPG